MAQRKIIWTKTADIQFVGVLEYWLMRNKSNAYPKKLVQLVSKRTKLIAKEPLLFRTLTSRIFAFRFWKTLVFSTELNQKK